MIEKYIPQAAPFVMVDTLLEATEDFSRTQLRIAADNLFVENSKFTEPGIIENMAQTAAAGTGYMANLKGEAPPVGFIGAIKSCEIFSLPTVGQTIVTEVTVIHSVMNAKIVSAHVRLENTVIAVAEFKIFLQ